MLSLHLRLFGVRGRLGGCAVSRYAQASYIGRTLFVNGRPVTAARLNPLPRYRALVPDREIEEVRVHHQRLRSVRKHVQLSRKHPEVGQINGAGGQGCTNVLYGYGKKIIWNAGRTNDQITEYKVPSNKVLKTLSLPYTFTSSCAMNTSGDIAVGILLGNSYGPAVRS